MLPLNLSHGKDKGFSLCFCFLSNAPTHFYDKLILQFHLGPRSPRMRRRRQAKWHGRDAKCSACGRQPDGQIRFKIRQHRAEGGH